MPVLVIVAWLVVVISTLKINPPSKSCITNVPAWSVPQDIDISPPAARCISIVYSLVSVEVSRMSFLSPLPNTATGPVKRTSNTPATGFGGSSTSPNEASIPSVPNGSIPKNRESCTTPSSENINACAQEFDTTGFAFTVIVVLSVSERPPLSVTEIDTSLLPISVAPGVPDSTPAEFVESHVGEVISA